MVIQKMRFLLLKIINFITDIDMHMVHIAIRVTSNLIAL